MEKNILVINCGSSSLKYKIFQIPSLKLKKKGLIEKIGEKSSHIKNHNQAIKRLFNQLPKAGINISEIEAIGHRVVHGGERFLEPVFIDKEVIRTIRKNIKLAPLHNNVNLEGILACKKILPSIKQVAVFDTAFYKTIPAYAYVYGLPFYFYKKHRIRRFGFHGLSHQYVAQESSRKLKKPLSKLKLITIHLGNGCSISAIDKGKCVDTSLGFTPLEGLIMGTRSGDLDPAIIFFMARVLGLSVDKIDHILNKQSGLLGISGVSNDVRIIKQAIKSGSQRAKLALDMFTYRIKKYIGAYGAVLGRVDAVVFTAGIGENNPDIIRDITKDLVSIFKHKPKILTIATNEELMIAKLTYGKINGLRRKREPLRRRSVC